MINDALLAHVQSGNTAPWPLALVTSTGIRVQWNAIFECDRDGIQFDIIEPVAFVEATGRKVKLTDSLRALVDARMSQIQDALDARVNING